MDGTMAGNILGIACFLAEQFFCIGIAFLFLKKERGIIRLWMGSVFGSIFAAWAPALFLLCTGKKLSYPFLCSTISDTISYWTDNQLLVDGIPAAFAFLQVVFGMFFLAELILKSVWKAAAAWCFFFLNLGLGADGTVHWANVLVHFLPSQREALFGWAVLFSVLYILYRAVITESPAYFVVAAVLSASLPMFHIYSFLALGFICAMWLIYSLRTALNAAWRTQESKIELVVLFLFFLLMCTLDAVQWTERIPAAICVGFALVGLAFIGAAAVILLIRAVRGKCCQTLLLSWGGYLGVTGALALPQLAVWIIPHVVNGGMVRGYFNWASINDTYLGFYLKIFGPVWVLGVIALIFTRSRNYFMVSPVFPLWYVAEFIVFQADVYGNSMILYIGYLFLCLLAADYLVEVVQKLSGLTNR